jgi:hypothetical protein
MGKRAQALRLECVPDGGERPAQADAPTSEVDVRHIKAVFRGECSHRLYIVLTGAVCVGKFLPRERASLGRELRRLLIDPVKR